MSSFDAGKEARIHYESGDYRVIQHGDFVRCAVTGAIIPIDDLRYWSAERQEAYLSPAEVLKAHKLKLGPKQ